MENFEKKLKEYAELLIRVGLHIEKGMELMPENRLQSMEELFQGLFSQQAPAPAKAPEKEPEKPEVEEEYISEEDIWKEMED